MFNRLTKIDNSMLGDHYYLNINDYCTFMGEYTAKKGHSYSQTNQLIYNFKKPISTKGTPQWRYKELAISAIGHSLANCIGDNNAEQITIVPIPPSKSRSDPDYDDRLVRALDVCKQRLPNIDYRELVVQTVSTNAVHTSENRPQPEFFTSIYQVDNNQLTGTRGVVLIFDDMLTTGCHYRAMETVLRPYFTESKMAGLFVARRVPETDFF